MKMCFDKFELSHSELEGDLKIRNSLRMQMACSTRTSQATSV